MQRHASMHAPHTCQNMKSVCAMWQGAGAREGERPGLVTIRWQSRKASGRAFRRAAATGAPIVKLSTKWPSCRNTHMYIHIHVYICRDKSQHGNREMKYDHAWVNTQTNTHTQARASGQTGTHACPAAFPFTGTHIHTCSKPTGNLTQKHMRKSGPQMCRDTSTRVRDCLPFSPPYEALNTLPVCRELVRRKIGRVHHTIMST